VSAVSVTVSRAWLADVERHAANLVWLLAKGEQASALSEHVRDASIAHACDALTDLLADDWPELDDLPQASPPDGVGVLDPSREAVLTLDADPVGSGWPGVVPLGGRGAPDSTGDVEADQ